MAKKNIPKVSSKKDTTVITPRYKIESHEFNSYTKHRQDDTTHRKVMANAQNETLTAKRNIERQKAGEPLLKSGKTFSKSFVEPKGLTHAQRPLKIVAKKKK